MTTLSNGTPTTEPRHAGSGVRPMPAPPPAPVVRGRRRPGLLALGVALVATGALLSAWLVGRAGDRVPVLVVARDVPYGATLERADLMVSEVFVQPDVSTVPATDVELVVGATALVPLVGGTLLSADAVGASAGPPPGHVVVGLAVAATRMPAGGLTAGDRVRVVSTPPRDADAPGEPPPSIAVTVLRLGEPDLDGTTVVDAVTSQQDGPVLAAWSATGRIALLLEPSAG